MTTITIQELYDWAVAHGVQDFQLYSMEECYQCVVDLQYIEVYSAERAVVL